MNAPNKPIYNCHTHIFKGINVPPYLAKSFVWPPIYFLVHLPSILWIFKTFLKIRDKQKYTHRSIYNRIRKFIERLKKNPFTKFLLILILAWLSINAAFILITWLSSWSPPSDDVSKYVELVKAWLVKFKIVLVSPHWLLALSIVLFVFSFVKLARNLIFFLLKSVWKFLGFIPGKQTKELFERYLLLGRFALYKTQSRIFTKLRSQYPSGSKFIVLPMDMEFMGAGKLKPNGCYKAQMEELVEIKSGSFGKYAEPFVFIDPRRIRESETFLNYSITPNQVELDKDCDVYNYIEKNKFSGFKIYPALGYYPFDEDLLALWHYAAKNQIPIMTHCVGGTIFYRGPKLEEWDTHPIFLESDGIGNTKPLSLPEKKNIEFSINFTNPLNYLCLLSEPLLRKVVAKAKNEHIRVLFGYTDAETELANNLSELKICLAHFGGEEQWVKYLEADRYPFAQRLIRDRSKGIKLDLEGEGSLRWSLLEQLWKFTDWYSIICSLILNFPNVYADISYILSKPRILPLLKETLDEKLNPHLSKRILFGTDFYVVRNHFSEKDLMAQMSAGLSEEEFDLIARYNPESYLRPSPTS